MISKKWRNGVKSSRSAETVTDTSNKNNPMEIKEIFFQTNDMKNNIVEPVKHPKRKNETSGCAKTAIPYVHV
jgi:hypothetical protein